MNMWKDIHKQNLSVYDIKGEEKTLRTLEIKEQEHDGYVCMYERGKHLLYSMYECVWEAQEKATSMLLFTVHKTV